MVNQIVEAELDEMLWGYPKWGSRKTHTREQHPTYPAVGWLRELNRGWMYREW